MITIDGGRPQPGAAAVRVERAWAAADPFARRALLAACATSAAVAAVVPVATAVRIAVAITGQLLAAAALVDVHERKLPNRLLAAAGAVTAAGAVVAGQAVVSGMAFGLLAAGVPMLLVRLTRGIGMGDVKAAAVVGASVGSVRPIAAPVAVAVAAFAGATYGMVAGRRRVPFGPALWFGWAAALTGVALGWQ